MQCIVYRYGNQAYPPLLTFAQGEQPHETGCSVEDDFKAN